jgi:alpha-beta hydrolase superfamily lysophospholipase
MDIERLAIRSGDHEVPSVIIIPPFPRGAAVLAHGYGGCKEELLGLAWRVAEQGLVACVIDLRGHGEHQLVMDTEFLVDMEAAIRHCRQFGKVVAIGHSLGGRLALMSSADFSIGISPPLDPHYCERTQELLQKVRSYRVKQENTKALFEYLRNLPSMKDAGSGRILIIYGSRDVPEILESCDELKTAGANVVKIDEAKHGDTYLLEATFATISQQLSKWFKQ